MIFNTCDGRWKAGCTGDGWGPEETFTTPEEAHEAALAHAAEPKTTVWQEVDR
ncbi:hypothetical protein [Acidipropionibacterium acidipropionici]|uniref:hypothetical protein n=1 Tax=Acidipropionibacterium acidipropionici TaxID=1748 RepID=UPI0015865608|nr:hypothetical protein [Acidipropionibacterium acidipropionici]